MSGGERLSRRRQRWSSEEDEVLRKYVAEHGEDDWHAEELLKRSGRGCSERWRCGLRTTVAQHPLTDEEKTIFWQLYQSFGASWQTIRRRIRGTRRFSVARTEFDIKNYIEQVLLMRAQGPNRNPNDVNDNDGNLEAPGENIDRNNEEAVSNVEALRSTSEGVRLSRRRRRWSPEEDEVLRMYVAEHGENNWCDAEKLLKRSSTGCRQRWWYNLRSTVTQHPLTDEEKTKIRQLYETFGARYDAIRRHTPKGDRFSVARTEFDIKNYIEQALLEQATGS